MAEDRLRLPLALAGTDGDRGGWYSRDWLDNRGGPHVITHPFALLLAEPMHFTMQLRQFRNLRRRVTAP